MSKKTPYNGVYGIKIGSKYTVIYDGSGTPKTEVTCVRRRLLDMEGKFVYDFSNEAEGFVDSLYPLKQGIPRNDAGMTITESVKLTRAYVSQLLQDIPKESGIVFCLPLIRAKEGLAALKSSIIDTCVKKDDAGNIIEYVKAQRGIKFFSEARGAAFGTLPTPEIVGTNVLVLNFGSSTIEVIFHAGNRMVEQNVYTFGGSEIDKRLMNAIMQEHRGALCDEKSAREIKEQYSLIKNNNVPKTLSQEGLKYDVVVSGNLIKEVVSNAIDQLILYLKEQFFRAAEMANPKAVASLQSSGRGYLVLCGGMVNMEGFADELHNKMTGTGVINSDVVLAVPKDGVVAPAIGAWRVGQVLEGMRLRKSLSTWPDLDNSTTNNR